MMPKLLAIETATSACSVALTVDGQVLNKMEVGNNIHSKVLLNMIQLLLDQASICVQDIDGIVVGQGPGSFTGLRIGVGVAQGIAYGCGCQLYGVSSLTGLAQQAQHELNLQKDALTLVGLDARMGEIYFCAFENNTSAVDDLVKPVGEISLYRPVDFDANEFELKKSTYEQIVLVGNAWSEYVDSIEPDFIADKDLSSTIVHPQAQFLLPHGESNFKLGRGTSPMNFKADYVRNNVAKKSQRKGLNFT